MYKTITAITIIISLFTTTTVATALPDNPQTIKELAEDGVNHYFGEGQWKYFEQIIHKESSWIHTGYHYPLINGKRRSSAVGLCGTLVKTHGLSEDFIDNTTAQIEWCMQYTKSRYGTPKKALEFHLKNGWW